ncbi:DUF2924 domain-containing protein [Brevundimonas subvibrioides]|uniref:DUF2924 domain-containing protein n=1 Tax=Brevundimonas subvibrioides TaxID=74313 RepID=UPI0022B3F5BD|nr:DUF2924 domain-containing protein [Brevundimonas subvibrioides]
MSPDEAAGALETMSLQELRQEWRTRFGAPPSLRSVELVRRSLAWLIQTSAFGGIDQTLRRQLRGQAARGGEVDDGARIVREWQGQRHEVEKVEGGYLYAGRRWKSLSGIATAISGTQRNGPKFFGLRQD